MHRHHSEHVKEAEESIDDVKWRDASGLRMASTSRRSAGLGITDMSVEHCSRRLARHTSFLETSLDKIQMKMAKYGKQDRSKFGLYNRISLYLWQINALEVPCTCQANLQPTLRALRTPPPCPLDRQTKSLPHQQSQGWQSNSVYSTDCPSP